MPIVYRTYRTCFTLCTIIQHVSGDEFTYIQVGDGNSEFSLMHCSMFEGVSCCRGLFRSDMLIGTAAVKLLPLETKCTIHDSFDVSSIIHNEIYTG